jgi:pimeloyl-ACP methyl ester carboxylesterase
VLLHGLGLTWRSWKPVLPALERRHEVFALDLPGFGDAPPLPRDVRPTPASFATALARELDALGLTQPALAGNSLGGWFALELAVRGRAARVVAISPAGLESPPERAFVIAMNELMRIRAKAMAPLGRVATTPPALRSVLFGGLRSRPWLVPPEDGADELSSFGRARGFQRTLAWTEGARAPAALGRIAVPVRIAFGTSDLMLGAYTAPRFATMIPGAELVPLPGLGHVPMADDPEAVAGTILEFTAPAGAPPA